MTHGTQTVLMPSEAAVLPAYCVPGCLSIEEGRVEYISIFYLRPANVQVAWAVAEQGSSTEHIAERLAERGN